MARTSRGMTTKTQPPDSLILGRRLSIRGGSPPRAGTRCCADGSSRVLRSSCFARVRDRAPILRPPPRARVRRFSASPTLVSGWIAARTRLPPKPGAPPPRKPWHCTLIRAARDRSPASLPSRPGLEQYRPALHLHKRARGSTSTVAVKSGVEAMTGWFSQVVADPPPASVVATDSPDRRSHQGR
jgi:hypothetical protein